MRRSVVLALVLVLALGVPTFAGFSGSVEFSVKTATDTTNFTKPDEDWKLDDPTTKITVSFSGSQEGIWEVSGTLDKDLGIDDLFLKAVAPEFTFYAVKDTDDSSGVGELKDPLGLVTLGDLTGKTGARLESSLLGPKVTLQAAEGKLGLAGSYSAQPLTVGGVTNLTLPGAGTKLSGPAAGYATVNLGIATVTGSFGVDTSKSDKNSGFGGKVTVTPIQGLTVNGSLVRKDVNFGDATTVSTDATLVQGLLRFKAAYSDTKNVSAGAAVSSSVSASVDYRGSEENQAFDDLFKSTKYYLNKAIAANASFELKKAKDSQLANPTTVLGAKAVAPLIPGVAVAKVEFLYESDKDSEFTAFTDTSTGAAGVTRYVYKSADTHMKLDGRVNYKLSDKVTFAPYVTVQSWGNADVVTQTWDATNNTWGKDNMVKADAGSVSQIDLGGELKYTLSDAATIKFGVARSNYGLPAGGAKTSAQKTSLTTTVSVSF